MLSVPTRNMAAIERPRRSDARALYVSLYLPLQMTMYADTPGVRAQTRHVRHSGLTQLGRAGASSDVGGEVPAQEGRARPLYRPAAASSGQRARTCLSCSVSSEVSASGDE